MQHIAATSIAAHRLSGNVAEGRESEIRVKQLAHEDLLRM
jgi:hypothetical protein